MQTQAFIDFIDQQAVQWNLSAKHEAWLEKTYRSDDLTAARSTLSRNYVRIWPDVVAHTSRGDDWVANALFTRNFQDVLTVRG